LSGSLIFEAFSIGESLFKNPKIRIQKSEHQKLEELDKIWNQ